MTPPSPLEETQAQLRDLTREIVELRKQNDLLKEQNRRIPELEEKCRVLAQGLDQEISKRSNMRFEESRSLVLEDIQHDGSIESLLNEISLLKSSLNTKDITEQDLRRELVTLKSCTNSQEFKCKQIIASCVGIPLENVEALLDPLLRAIQSDDPMDVLDMNQVSGFMSKIKDHEKSLYK